MPRIEALVQLLVNRAVRRVEEQLGDLQFGSAQHHLHRLGETFPQHGGAQDIVAVDHALQSTAEIVQSRPVT